MRIAVLGAGNSGRAMAAHLAMAGTDVALWNRSEASIQRILDSHEIETSGAISGRGRLVIVSNDMAAVVDGADLVIVCTSAVAHASVAGELARSIEDLPPVLLSPGRVLGIFDFIESAGREFPAIAEAQTAPHTARILSGQSVHVFSVKRSVPVAGATPEAATEILDLLPDQLRAGFTPQESWVATSLGSVGPVLHPVPMVLNAGRIESPSGFRFYTDGVTPSVARLMGEVDRERCEVGEALGHRPPSILEWFSNSYGVGAIDLLDAVRQVAGYRFIDAPQSLTHRYLDEDVGCGLVPIEALAAHLGVQTPASTAVISMAEELTGQPYRKNGRSGTLIDIALRSRRNPD